MLAQMVHPPTWLAAHAERAVSRALGGSCSMPLAAHAVWEGQLLRLEAALGDAQQPTRGLLRVFVHGQPRDAASATAMGEEAAARLRAAGADSYLTDLPG
jgi:hydroxymethylbilane synthase